MFYKIDIIYSKEDTSEKPIFEIDNFPETYKVLKRVYGELVERPALRKNKGYFRKIVTDKSIILRYLFETEEQARDFYSTLTDESNFIKKQMTEMFKKIPYNQYSKTVKTVVFKNSNGETLNL